MDTDELTANSRQSLIDLIDGGSQDSALEVSDGHDTVSGRTIEASPTALQLDDWSIRRGAEVLAASERLAKTFQSQVALPERCPEDVAKATVEAEWEKLREPAALATADFHAAAFEPDPQLATACKNERIHKYMQSLMQTPEFQALHAETQLDETASEIAAASFAEQWVALVKQAEPEDEFKKDIQCLKAASSALGGASKEVSDLRDAQNALGIGGEGGGKSSITSADLAKVFKRVKGSPQLKRICDLAGRYRRFAQAQQRKKVLHGRDDVVGVVLDGDVGRLLPHELAALTDPDLELDVMRRLVERQAMCRDYRGIESKARGPIVVVVDESGSMSGEKIHTAKAMALALAWVARHQKRWCCLVGFSGGSNGTFCVAPPKGSPRFIDYDESAAAWREGPDCLLEWLEHFYSGGTTCDVPLVELPKNWEALGTPKGITDIICITDAIVDVPDKMRESFLAWKLRERVKMVSLILESEPGDLALVSDRTHKVKSLSLEEEAVAEAMSV